MAEVQMGSVGCDGEDELRPTATDTAKKLKLPRKVLEACNAVNHSSVPRKLRSVIKKRSCKPNFPTLPIPKRLNHSVNGFPTTKRESLKQSKLNMGSNNHPNSSPRQVTSVLISKAEKEVAETLFALAGMITKNNTTMADDGESPTVTAKKLEDSVPVDEGLSVPNEESVVTCTPTYTDVINPTLSKKVSPEDNAPMESSNESTLLSHPNLFENAKLNLNADASPLPVNFPALSTLPKTQNCDITAAQGSICLKAKLSLERLNEFGQNETLNAQRTSANAGDVAYQVEQKHPQTGIKENGSELWLGFNPRSSDGSEAGKLPSQSLAAMNLSWPSSVASSSNAVSHKCRVSCEKVPQVATINGKKRSRCTAHVYISHFIRSLQISGDQLRPSEGDINLSSSSNRVRSHSHTYSSFTEMREMSFLEDSNSVLTSKRLSHDQEASGNSTLRKQRVVFQSLSSVKGEPEAKSINGKGNGICLEPSTELPMHHLNSLAQHSVVASLSSLPSNPLPCQNWHSASAARTQPIQQVHLPLRPYLGRPLGPAQVDNNRIQVTNQPQTQPQRWQQQPSQHQNPIWIAQLPSYYRPNGFSFLNWQNNSGRQDPSLVQYIQTPLLPSPRSSASLELPKYLSLSQPLPPIRAKAPPQSLVTPFGHEENGVRFPHPEAGLQLQLLCNEPL